MSVFRPMSVLCVVCCVLLWSVSSFAQTPDDAAQPDGVRVGFGLKYLGLSDSLVSGAGQVVVPVELDGLRLEPGFSLGVREGQDELLLSYSASLGVHWLVELNAWVRGYGGLFGSYSSQEYSDVGSFSFVQLGPVVGLEAQVIEGLYLGIEPQLIYTKGTNDQALGGLGGLSATNTLSTRSLLVVRLLF